MDQTRYLRSDLFSLLELQRLDSELDRYKAGIERQKVDPDVIALGARAKEASVAAARAKERVASLRHKAAWEEKEADSIREEVNDMERKMYGGMVSSPKELDQMQKRVEKLREDLGKHEEAGLLALDELEQAVPAEDEAEKASREARRLYDEALARQKAAIADLEAKIVAVTPRREAMSTRVPATLLALYERIRKVRNGVGAAALGRSGLCGACLVEVPRGLAKKILAGDLETCESCGRLLIRSDETFEQGEAPETE